VGDPVVVIAWGGKYIMDAARGANVQLVRVCERGKYYIPCSARLLENDIDIVYAQWIAVRCCIGLQLPSLKASTESCIQANFDFSTTRML
jgi:hypothetical protein